ncbi:LapA family protein [Devriesea agamarum]|uniref:LapA family protein n=1 Tax=Devriesea agamarum TaxID=472569 RepID=UPI00071C60E4|nr:lipopolysaccharide assembly protein LapA domain-containing protein [Devriesea agamarum]
MTTPDPVPPADIPATSNPQPTAEPSPTSARRSTAAPAPAPKVKASPESADHQGGGKTAAVWISLIIGAVILVLLLVFIIQNSASTQFTYFSAQFSLPLGVAMLLAAIAGALVMALVGSVRMLQMAMRIRRLEKQQAKAKRAFE